MAHPLYSTSTWKRLRACQLQREPFCRMCEQLGRMTAATVVDHVQPHRGDRSLFFDAGNLSSLCATCHNGAKQRLEKGGALPGCTPSGRPLDPSHPWNQR